MTDTDFIEQWNKYETTQEIADATGYTVTTVRSKATRLRKRGFNVPRKTDGDFFAKIGRIGKNSGPRKGTK